MNELADPESSRGREAEHPAEGTVEVGRVGKAGGVGCLGDRRSTSHLSQCVTQPQPEQVTTEGEPKVRP